MWLKEQLSHSKKGSPQFGLCCLSGKVKVESLPDPPAQLVDLLTKDDPQARRFRSNIRKFNAGLAMASMKATDASVQGGVASYTVQGVVYRRIGPLRNASDREPACLQTYFYDEEEQVSLLP
jgi:hypothetical protein